MAVVQWQGSAVALDGPAHHVEQVLASLPPFYERGTRADVTGTLTEDDGLVTLHLEDGLSISGPPGAELYRAAASRLELVLVDRLPDLIAVHAGVVADDEGAILLPGRSMVGKSTLTRALLAHGLRYFSDEFALLDADGKVHPYPRAMTMRTATGSERHVPENAAVRTAPPRLVALLHFDERGWNTRDLTPGEAVMGLVDNCVSIRRDPARALTALTRVAERSHAVQGTRGDADDAATRLLMLRARPASG